MYGNINTIFPSKDQSNNKKNRNGACILLFVTWLLIELTHILEKRGDSRMEREMGREGNIYISGIEMNKSGTQVTIKYKRRLMENEV